MIYVSCYTDSGIVNVVLPFTIITGVFLLTCAATCSLLAVSRGEIVVTLTS